MIDGFHNNDGLYKLRFSHPIRRQRYDPITQQLIVETDSVKVGEEIEIDNGSMVTRDAKQKPSISQLTHHINNDEYKQINRRPIHESDAQDITVIFINQSDGLYRTEMPIKTSISMKTLFYDYAQECGLSLRSLRFSFNGRVLFLSSLGCKTAKDLNIVNLDKFIVTRIQELPPEEDPTPINCSKRSTKCKKSISNNKKSHRKKRNTKRTIALDESDDKLKEAHSIALTKIFEEAEPLFKDIRRNLNNLTLERRRPKRRTFKSSEVSPVSIVHNHATSGLGGKAGKSSYAVNVGQVENLYISSKRNPNSISSKQRTCIDLHGYTVNHAVKRLDNALVDWVDTAMKGEYPWVIPVDIICGAGNQILSETVEKWIKSKAHVANAPKRSLNV
jgi:hypothetical protein